MIYKPQSYFVLALALASLLSLTTSIEAQVIFNDSWTDGGRTDGDDEKDTNWWTSTSADDALEVSKGSLGLVSGETGRGIRATFAPQKLEIGESIEVTYKFTTPATVGPDENGGFRVAIFDKVERSGLESDLTTSSGSPNALYDGLPGYMADYDSNLSDAKQNVTIRKHNLTSTTGRLLGTTSGYDSLGNGGDDYEFAVAKTEYVGKLSVTRTGEDTAEISTSLSQGGKVLTSHKESDKAEIANNFGMVAFHANSDVFGSSNAAGEEDNGIDFSNVVVERKPAAKSGE